MPRHIAFLRAVNVGGTGKLPMAELKAMCGRCGFTAVRTHIASGNAVFDAPGDEVAVREALGRELSVWFGAPWGLVVRAPDEVARVLADNPFPGADPKQLVVLLLPRAARADDLTDLRHRTDEDVRLGERCLYIHYPRGMGASKLVLPVAREGTGRNLGTLQAVLRLTTAA